MCYAIFLFLLAPFQIVSVFYSSYLLPPRFLFWGSFPCKYCKCDCPYGIFFFRGQTPAESDFQILEIARKLEMYGVRFHPAADREDTKINLSVSHMGLQVFQVTAAFVMTPCPFDL